MSAYKVEGRTIVVTVAGRTHRIPDMWLVGATHGGRTIAQAVQLWHEQAEMEEGDDPMTPATFAHLDDALREASLMCHSDDAKRVIIYCSTHPDVADPSSGEKYLVFQSHTPMRHHLRDDQGWHPVYTVSEGDQ